MAYWTLIESEIFIMSGFMSESIATESERHSYCQVEKVNLKVCIVGGH